MKKQMVSAVILAAILAACSTDEDVSADAQFLAYKTTDVLQVNHEDGKPAGIDKALFSGSSTLLLHAADLKAGRISLKQPTGQPLHLESMEDEGRKLVLAQPYPRCRWKRERHRLLRAGPELMGFKNKGSLFRATLCIFKQQWKRSA